MKKTLLEAVKHDPIALRDVIKDLEVLDALSSIGVLPKVLELHAPSTQSRKKDGLGRTLCGINGTRHERVTCARCLKQLRITDQ
jgi:hypothetical protein